LLHCSTSSTLIRLRWMERWRRTCVPIGITLDADLDEGVQLPGAHSRTRRDAFHILPDLLAVKILRPERPGAALCWSQFIHAAQRLAGHPRAIKEHAIESSSATTHSHTHFVQRPTRAQFSCVFLEEYCKRKTKPFRECARFFITHPHRARRTRTTIPARCTFKPQTIRVPLTHESRSGSSGRGCPSSPHGSTATACTAARRRTGARC